MQLLPLLLLGAIASTSASPTYLSISPFDATFDTTFLFTATIGLGQPPPGAMGPKAITVPGGVLVPEPIPNGTVAGPYINGTILGGLASPSIYNNQTLQVPVINIYGVTDDGYPFYIHETGIGLPTAQVTRIVGRPPDSVLILQVC